MSWEKVSRIELQNSRLRIEALQCRIKTDWTSAITQSFTYGGATELTNKVSTPLGRISNNNMYMSHRLTFDIAATSVWVKVGNFANVYPFKQQFRTNLIPFHGTFEKPLVYAGVELGMIENNVYARNTTGAVKSVSVTYLEYADQVSFEIEVPFRFIPLGFYRDASDIPVEKLYRVMHFDLTGSIREPIYYHEDTEVIDHRFYDSPYSPNGVYKNVVKEGYFTWQDQFLYGWNFVAPTYTDIDTDMKLNSPHKLYCLNTEFL